MSDKTYTSLSNSTSTSPSNIINTNPDQEIEIIHPAQIDFTHRSTFKTLCFIFSESIKGITTICLSFSGFIIESIYLGHLQDSKLYLSGINSARLWIYIIYFIGVYFNSGLGIYISRCIAKNDYKRIKRFLHMNMICLLFICLAILLMVVIMYFVTEKMYKSLELVAQIKVSYLISFPLFFLLVYADCYRNLYIA